MTSMITEFDEKKALEELGYIKIKENVPFYYDGEWHCIHSLRDLMLFVSYAKLELDRMDNDIATLKFQ